MQRRIMSKEIILFAVGIVGWLGIFVHAEEAMPEPVSNEEFTDGLLPAGIFQLRERFPLPQGKEVLDVMSAEWGRWEEGWVRVKSTISPTHIVSLQERTARIVQLTDGTWSREIELPADLRVISEWGNIADLCYLPTSGGGVLLGEIMDQRPIPDGPYHKWLGWSYFVLPLREGAPAWGEYFEGRVWGDILAVPMPEDDGFVVLNIPQEPSRLFDLEGREMFRFDFPADVQSAIFMPDHEGRTVFRVASTREVTIYDVVWPPPELKVDEPPVVNNGKTEGVE